MKFSVNWLREFVESPPSIDALAELLTMSGVEIEAIEKRGADFDCVVVAQIIESKPHPNADRLTVCVVDDGSGTKRQIVRSEEHTSELQSLTNLVCRLLLEKKNKT